MVVSFVTDCGTIFDIIDSSVLIRNKYGLTIAWLSIDEAIEILEEHKKERLERRES